MASTQQDAHQGAPVNPQLTGDALSNAIEARLIKGFTNEINNLKVEIVSLKSRAAPVPRHRLDHPEPLDGPLRWDTWLPLMKAKLRIDAEAIGSKEAQFFYVYGNLESKVQALVLPQLHAAEEGEYDPQAIIDQLARIYEDPNKVERATNKLSHIKQGSDSFTIYLARFERLLYEARANTWPDAAKIAALRAGLDSSMVTKLATQLTLPTAYPEFVKVLQRLASQSTFRPPSAPASGHDSNNRGFQKKVGFAGDKPPSTEVGAVVPYQPTIAKRPANGGSEKQLWGMEYNYGEEELSE